MPGKFIQLACTATHWSEERSEGREGGLYGRESLYALDEEGVIWEWRHDDQAFVRLEGPKEAPEDPEHPHLIGGEFQSDKYPTTPRGKVPLSCKDKTAQDLLWRYAQRRREVDAQFANDLEIALRSAGYEPSGSFPIDEAPTNTSVTSEVARLLAVKVNSSDQCPGCNHLYKVSIAEIERDPSRAKDRKCERASCKYAGVPVIMQHEWIRRAQAVLEKIGG